MAKLKKLTEPWQEFADAWLSFLEETTDVNEDRLHKAVDNYWVGENESKQEDWVWETKQTIGKIKENDRDSWRKIFNFIKERYHEHPEIHEKILKIAESKKIGEYVWKI